MRGSGNAQRTRTDIFLSDVALRIFLLNVFFYCRQKSGIAFYTLVSFGTYGPIFYRSYYAVTTVYMAGEVQSLDFFYQTEVGENNPIFILIFCLRYFVLCALDVCFLCEKLCCNANRAHANHLFCISLGTVDTTMIY